MKTIFTLILCALALTGCASNDYALYAKGQAESDTARHNADAAKYKAMADIAASGDGAAKVAAVMAMALGGNSGAKNTIQAPQASQALQWASILVPGLTQVAGMRYNYLSQQTQSNNATALAQSSFTLQQGYTAKAVYAAEALKREGSTRTYTRANDGYRETINFAVAPASAAWVSIMAVRSN